MTVVSRGQTPRCRNKDCTLSEGGVCARIEEFEDPLAECPDLVRPRGAAVTKTRGPAIAGAVRVQPSLLPVAETSSERDAAPSSVAARAQELPAEASTERRAPAGAAPWSGRHLSEAEANHLMNASPARVFGVVGPFSAGKTCLLASLFLQLADGQCERLGYRFASSRTLFALQTLCRELAAWDGKSDGLMVSHTPKGEAGEAGSFLHLGLRPRAASDDRHIDVLLGDVAGERFTELTSLADEATARRMAFLRRCDGFLLIVDAAVLLGETGRRLDADLARMLGRVLDLLAEESRKDAPVAVVLTKIDKVPQVPRPAADGASTPELRELVARRAPRLATTLRRAREAGVPHEIFAVSAIPSDGQPIGVQEPFRYLLSFADRCAPWPRWTPPVPEGPIRSFMTLRAWRDAP